MATETGAAALGFQGVGRIETGAAADLALFSIDRMEYTGSLSDPFAALLFAGFNHGTDYTICNGKVVVEKGRLVGVDEERLMKDGNRIAARLLDA